MMNPQPSASRIAMLLAVMLTLTGPVHAIIPAAYQQYQQGVSLEEKQDFRGAEQAYRMAIALDPYDALTYIRLASIVERDGRRDEALTLYEKAIMLNPADPGVHVAMAQILEAKHQPEKALEQYKLALSPNANYPYAYLPMARLEKTLSRPGDAITAYQAFLKAYPKHYDAQRELAGLLLAEQKYADAAETYKTLKSLDASRFKDDLALGIALSNADKPDEALEVFQGIQTPSVALYEHMGASYEKLNRLPEAYNVYQKAIALAPREKPDLHLKMADISASLNRPDDAIVSLKAYLKADPKNGKVGKSLADLYLKKNDYTNAIAMYQQALPNLTASSDKAFRNETLRKLGYSYQMQDNLDTAVEWYEKSLAAEDNSQTRLNLALAYHKQAKYDKALDLYRKLLIEDSQSATIRKDMGQVLLAIGDQGFKKQDYKAAMNAYQDAFLLGAEQEVPALMGIANTHYALKNTDLAYTTYQRVLERDPNHVMARMNKAQIDLDRKKYMEALENLRWVTQQRPTYLDAYKLLGKTHEQLGDYGQAILSYQKGLELQPKDVTLLIGYGNALRHAGEMDKARQTYETAREMAPENALVRYNLGSVYGASGKLEASQAEYRKAVELNPGFSESYYGLGTTLEKQNKPLEALEVYKQYLQKAPITASYVPLAKERIQVLQKSMVQKATPPTPKLPAKS